MTTPRHKAEVGEYALIIVMLAVTFGLTVVFYSAVPDPIASHWGFNGEPDDKLPRAVDAVLIFVLVASCGLLVWAAGRADRPAARLLVAFGNGLAVFFTALRYLTYTANVDAATWQDAGLLTGIDMLGAFGIGLLGGAVGFVASANRPDHVVCVRHVTALEKAGAPETFDAYISARLMMVVPPIVAASGVLLYVSVPPPGGAVLAGVCVLVAVLAALFTRARVHVDAEGVKVSLGPFGFPTVRRRTAHIRDVGVLDVEPLSYGGWGYRAVPGARAVVLRRGEGIRIMADGKPDLIVTVDDAATAAAVIASHMRDRQE